MISFLNDYNEIGHPKILQEMLKLQDKKFVGYSEDEEVKKAILHIKKHLNDENVDIHFVHTGTMANVLGVIFSLKRYESVISADTGHIINTENGSIEACGHQIIQVPNHNGKVTVEEIEKALNRQKNEYSSKPGVVYISNATELGTIYKKSELEALHNCCKKNGLYLFMDGARLGTAIMSEESDIKFEDLTKYLDIFTIGGNKNGFIFGEALVIVNDELKSKHERRLIKQQGSLLAKGFLYGIQFRVMFENNLFFENAKHAVKMAKKLAEVFIKKGYRPLNNVESNLVFIDLPEEIHEKLSQNFMYTAEKIDEGKVHCRFVTTWNTKIEEIKKLEDKFDS